MRWLRVNTTYVFTRLIRTKKIYKWCLLFICTYQKRTKTHQNSSSASTTKTCAKLRGDVALERPPPSRSGSRTQFNFHEHSTEDIFTQQSYRSSLTTFKCLTKDVAIFFHTDLWSADKPGSNKHSLSPAIFLLSEQLRVVAAPSALPGHQAPSALPEHYPTDFMSRYREGYRREGKRWAKKKAVLPFNGAVSASSGHRCADAPR